MQEQQNQNNQSEQHDEDTSNMVLGAIQVIVGIGAIIYIIGELGGWSFWHKYSNYFWYGLIGMGIYKFVTWNGK